MTIDLAYCGLDCAACPAYHAVERLTIDERQAAATRWNAQFGGTHTVADIDCVGCTHEGRHAPFCESGCHIRVCGANKTVATCAECPQFDCERLASFLVNVPEARDNLEARRLARR